MLLMPILFACLLENKSMHYHSPLLQPWDSQPIHITNNTQHSIVLSKYKMRKSVLLITMTHCEKGIRRDKPRLQG